MFEYSLPQLALHDLDLDCVDPHRSTDTDAAVAPLKGRIKLGGPVSWPITPEMVTSDEALRDYVEQESRWHQYHLVHLAVSFAARPVSPRLTSVAVDLTLSSTVTTPEPVAVSMTPPRLTSPVQVKRTVRFGPKLKFQEMEVSVGEIDRESTYQVDHPFLVALNLERADPGWAFIRPKTTNLSGSYDLALVVRSARGSAAGLTCRISAHTRGNLVRRFARELANPLELSAVL